MCGLSNRACELTNKSAVV